MITGNVWKLKDSLAAAERAGCAIGSFSPRYVPMILPVLLAGERTSSPMIVQISQRELERYGIVPQAFAQEFYFQMREQAISVPVALHLDHTKDFEVIEAAIEAGFTSVMIDASEFPIDENIAITKRVVEYAHARGVSVEAELGRIGTTDFIETEHDEELYTHPDEALRFVTETGVDALAVSVGTAHGVYNVRQPKVDNERLKAIRALTDVHLVLHGGSGVPGHMIREAVKHGISKVNIATDLELALLKALGREERMTDAECRALPPDQLERGRAAVSTEVEDKIMNFLGSSGKAAEFMREVNR
jgi:fructose-bisphosphate aldolase class II